MRLHRISLLKNICLALLLIEGCWSPLSKSARQVFLNRTGRINVTIFPVNVIQGSAVIGNRQFAQGIGAFLEQQQLAEMTYSPDSIAIPVKWSHNQAKMARTRALAFATRVKELPLETDYALLVEILCNPAGTQVIGVHYYLADKSGQLADVRLTNSHWEEFKAVDPRTPEAGQIIVQKMLQKAWREL